MLGIVVFLSIIDWSAMIKYITIAIYRLISEEINLLLKWR